MPVLGPSVLSSWTQSIVAYLRARSIDSQPILRVAGIDVAALNDPHAHLPISATTRLWRAVAEATGDPACGLRISAFTRPTTFHALGFAVLASSTLGDALDRLQRYGRIMSDAGELRVESHSRGAALRLALRDPEFDIACESIDALFSLIVRVCRLLTSHSFAVLEVTLRRSEPTDSAIFERFYRCPVRFGCAENTLVLDRTELERTLPLANPELAQHGDRQVAAMIAQQHRQQFRARVMHVVARKLSSSVSPDFVAKSLGMSVRSLQRRLHEEGTSFMALVAETRADLAKTYLRDAQFSITEVAFLVGFADATAFARAFAAGPVAHPAHFANPMRRPPTDSHARAFRRARVC